MQYEVHFWREAGDWVVKGEWPWEHFLPSELVSPDDKHISPIAPAKVNVGAMNALETFRGYLGKPLVISSAYRSQQYNMRVGGATKSLHLQGRAFDLSFDTLDIHGISGLVRVIREASLAGFRGFGVYETDCFIHMDTGNPRQWEQAGSFFDDYNT